MPRDYAAKPHVCGFTFCPSVLRMLWPDPAFRHVDIAQIFDRCDTLIPRWAEGMGIYDQRPINRRKAAYSARRFREIWTDHSISRAEAARRIGLHPAVCARHAQRLGIPPRQNPTHFIAIPEDFNDMWRAGVSTQEIAKVTRCCGETVLKVAQRRGLGGRNTHFRAKITLVEYRLARAMAADARRTQLAYEITGREPRKHLAALKRLAA